jgi:hypothetical protein
MDGVRPSECVPHAERATFSKAALPNGIVLPEPWPPSGQSYADFVVDPPQRPQKPPQPPTVVRIDVGRQRFAVLTCKCRPPAHRAARQGHHLGLSRVLLSTVGSSLTTS